MEQFRAPIVEALVADLVNQNRITVGDFFPPDERGGLYLHPEALREFLLHWETKLQIFATHLYAGQDDSAVETASTQTKSAYAD